MARYRAVAALSTCLLNVSVCWQKSGRPITSEETETGGFGARSLILGFPWVIGFWVSFGDFGIPRSVHTRALAKVELQRIFSCH